MSDGRSKSGRSVLVILSLILASAGALRIGSGLGFALANSADATPAAPLKCPVPPVALAAALVGREAQVKAQEQALAERMAALNLADLAITKRMGELQVAEGDLKKTLAIADGAGLSGPDATGVGRRGYGWYEAGQGISSLCPSGRPQCDGAQELGSGFLNPRVSNMAGAQTSGGSP